MFIFVVVSDPAVAGHANFCIDLEDFLLGLCSLPAELVRSLSLLFRFLSYYLIRPNMLSCGGLSLTGHCHHVSYFVWSASLSLSVTATLPALALPLSCTWLSYREHHVLHRAVCVSTASQPVASRCRCVSVALSPLCSPPFSC